MSNHESSPIKKAVATSLVLGASLLPSITHAETNVEQAPDPTPQSSHALVNSQANVIQPLITTLETSISSPEKILDTSSSQFFPETNHSIDGIFLEYWNTHGGLAQQGYPLSERLQEISQTDGKRYTVQYFERAVFEDHPENDIENEVLLQLLGALKYNEKYPQGAPHQIANSSPDAVLFPETGHTIGGAFLEYWQSHGGLAQHGYPVSDEFQEIGEDGKNRTVQYFQRDEFENHTGEYEDASNDIQLTRIGDEYLHKRYDKPSATETPTPPAEATATPTEVVNSEGELTLEVQYKAGTAKFFAQPTGGILTDKIKPNLISLFNGIYDLKGYTTPIDIEYISLPAGTLDGPGGERTYINGQKIYPGGSNTSTHETFYWYTTAPEEIAKNGKVTEKIYFATSGGEINLNLLRNKQGTPDADKIASRIQFDLFTRYIKMDDTGGQFYHLLQQKPELFPMMGWDANGNFDGGANVALKILPPTP